MVSYMTAEKPMRKEHFTLLWLELSKALCLESCPYRGRQWSEGILKKVLTLQGKDCCHFETYGGRKLKPHLLELARREGAHRDRETKEQTKEMPEAPTVLGKSFPF